MAPPPTLHRIGQQTDILGESPVWDEYAQALYWWTSVDPRCVA